MCYVHGNVCRKMSGKMSLRENEKSLKKASMVQY